MAEARFLRSRNIFRWPVLMKQPRKRHDQTRRAAGTATPDAHPVYGMDERQKTREVLTYRRENGDLIEHHPDGSEKVIKHAK